MAVHDWLRHFLNFNHWNEFNETGQEASAQHPLPSLHFSGRSENPRCPHCLWSGTNTLTSCPVSVLVPALIGWNFSASSPSVLTALFRFVLRTPIAASLSIVFGHEVLGISRQQGGIVRFSSHYPGISHSVPSTLSLKVRGPRRSILSMMSL